MSNKRFYFGLIISILWLLIVFVNIYLLRADAFAMKPNEWGDFFAGVFAPLAFLWLVLGYLQQGEELKLSTKALLLQAEELKNSVEQQRELVEVSRQQVESEREALNYERKLREEAAMPHILVISRGGTFRGDGVSTYNVIFTNTGNTATDFSATLKTEDNRNYGLANIPVLDRGAQYQASFTNPTPLQGSETRLVLSYNDTLGRTTATTFAVSRLTDDPHSELNLLKITD